MTPRQLYDNVRAKGSDRIQINNLLSAISIGALFLLLSGNQGIINSWIISQIALSIPMLVTSSLAYAKTCYRDFSELPTWDFLGWFTHSVGYISIINAIFLLLFQFRYQSESTFFIFSVSILFILYSYIDFSMNKTRGREKIFKLLFYLGCIFFGSIIPLIFRWI